MDPLSRADVTGERVINEGTRFDLKGVLLIVGGVISIAGSWGQLQLSMAKMDSSFRAELVAVRADTENASEFADKAQDQRLTALENRLGQIQATNCAIARKLDVPTVGCGRRDE